MVRNACISRKGRRTKIAFDGTHRLVLFTLMPVLISLPGGSFRANVAREAFRSALGSAMLFL